MNEAHNKRVVQTKFRTLLVNEGLINRGYQEIHTVSPFFLIVLNENLFAIKAKRIPKVLIEMTFFEGKRVH